MWNTWNVCFQHVFFTLPLPWDAELSGERSVLATRQPKMVAQSGSGQLRLHAWPRPGHNAPSLGCLGTRVVPTPAWLLLGWPGKPTAPATMPPPPFLYVDVVDEFLHIMCGVNFYVNFINFLLYFIVQMFKFSCLKHHIYYLWICDVLHSSFWHVVKVLGTIKLYFIFVPL
jgi:hypothetical protein